MVTASKKAASATAESAQGNGREGRFTSHALLDVRRFKHLPFAVQSAILLDISFGGFKIEFTGEATIRPGHEFWFSMPLSPLGIFAPTRLLCRAECRWFDAERGRVGGVFTDLSKIDRHIIEQVIESLQKHGALPI